MEQKKNNQRGTFNLMCYLKKSKAAFLQTEFAVLSGYGNNTFYTNRRKNIV